MPRFRDSFRPKLDRRVRIINWAVGRRVEGVYQRGPVVFDGIVWAAKPSTQATFEVTEAGVRLQADESYIVRAFKTRANGLTEPEVPPYPAGTDFLVVDEDDRQLFVTAVNEVGRNRFLQLTVALVTDGPLPNITYADGYTPPED